MQLQGLALGQPLQVIGQFGRLRQLSAADQDRDDADTASQRPGQFTLASFSP